jgi:anti-anti-sigma regulatory factor
LDSPNTPAGWSRRQPVQDPSTDSPLVLHAQSLPSGATSLRAVGVIDSVTASLLEQRMVQEARLCRIQPARLLLDLNEVRFLDRIGLDTLLDLQTRLTDGFATLELLDATTGVVRLLHGAQFDGACWMPPVDR